MISIQGGARVTPIDPIVTAVTTLVNPYTKEGVESLLILPYTVNVHVVNSQWLKFNTVGCCKGMWSGDKKLI